MKRSIFVPFTRVSDDGSEVYGIATRELLDGKLAIDSYGTVFDYEQASKPAFTRWAEKFSAMSDGESKGNIRAMHNRIAAGKVADIDFLDDEKAVGLTIRVVDPVEQVKVKERVYTGLSIGFDNDKRRRERDAESGKTYERILHYDLVETSLVDNPSCPGASFRIDAPPEPQPDPAPAAAPAETPAGDPPEVKPAQQLRTRVALLTFDGEKFTAEQAREWAHKAGFRSKGLQELGAKVMAIRQRPADDFVAEGQRVEAPLSDGVTALIEQLKPEAVDRAEQMRALIGRAVDAAGKRDYLASEAYSLSCAAGALSAIFAALESEVFEAQMGGSSDDARQDVGYLATACEAVMEFIAAEFREQLQALSAEPARVVASMQQLRQAIGEARWGRVSSDPATQAKVRDVHRAALATLSDCHAMMQGAPPCGCPELRATDAAPIPGEAVAAAAADVPALTPPAADPEPAPAPAPAPDAAPEPGAAANAAPTPAPDPAAPAAPPETPTATDEKSEVEQLRAQVADLQAQVKRIGSTPDAFGMPVDQQGAGGAGRPVNPLVTVYERLVEAESDPHMRQQLALRAATLSLMPGAPSASR